MKISKVGLDLITSFEGYHRKLPNGDCTAYRCIIGKDRNGNPVHDGKWTIGFGCTEGITEGMVWTRQQADDAFRQELAQHERAVSRLSTVDLNQNQYDALVSFSYNCGTGIGTNKGGLANSSLLAKTNAGDPEGAARAFALYNKSKGMVVSGLVRRRAEEAALFRRPVAVAKEPDMPQTVDTPADTPEKSRIIATAATGEKLTVVGTLGGIGLSLADALGYGGQILPMVKDYGLQAFILVMLVLAAGFALIKHFRTEDHVQGKTVEAPT